MSDDDLKEIIFLSNGNDITKLLRKVVVIHDIPYGNSKR